MLVLLTLGVGSACGTGPASSEAKPSGGPVSPPPGAWPARGVYGKDASPGGHALQAAAGFNTFDVAPYAEQIDAMPAGARGFVWLGGWNKDTCTFARSDQAVEQLLAPIAGNPRIAAYYLGDEPLASKCPNGPAAFRARTQLVHRHDTRPTFTVIQEYDPNTNQAHPYAPWKGSVDIIGIDIYPCSFAKGCVWNLIPDAISSIDVLGVRYWAVLQDFEDSYYRLPTPAELAQQWRLWQASRAEGYLVFSWDWKATDLGSHPANVAELARENGQIFPARSR